MTKIAINAIRPNQFAMRSVDRDSGTYQDMVASIRRVGQIGSISVREKIDEHSHKYYEIIDGLHRYQAMLDAGIQWVNADINNLSDDQILETQIMASVHKIETKPIEYSMQLKRILTRNPLMTIKSLAFKLGKSQAWVGERLRLLRIKDEKIQSLIDEGHIKLINAYGLAKLPAEEQSEWVDAAMIMRPREFMPKVNARAQELFRAKRRRRMERHATDVSTLSAVERKKQLAAAATHRATEAAYAMTMPSKAAIERNLKLKGNAEDIKNELAKLKTFFDAALNKKMEKSAYDLLHGPVVDYKMIRPKGTSINAKHFVETANAPIQRRGWDNVTVDGRIAYCNGDILVYSINGYQGKKWAIKHPVLQSLHNESFEDAETAMQAVEAFLCT